MYISQIFCDKAKISQDFATVPQKIQSCSDNGTGMYWMLLEPPNMMFFFLI